jgi:hypothetical protein
MFSANENILLRQHKKRIVDQVEKTMPEEALDFGTTVMVMQVSCKAPGCVPLETAIIIVFPNHPEELVPGLPESKGGGNYKTKILKPMADVVEEDVLEALPPAFKGGRRTMEKLCRNARDVMLAQITQMFGEEDDDSVKDRQAMAEYLQEQLREYINRGCEAPEYGQDFPPLEEKKSDDVETTTVSSVAKSIKTQGNFVIKRPVDDNDETETETQKAMPSAPTSYKSRHQAATTTGALGESTSSSISRLFNREHAPGIRQAGCPCCDPDNPNNVIDTMMML